MTEPLSDRQYRIRSLPVLKVARELGLGRQIGVGQYRYVWLFTNSERAAALREFERRGGLSAEAEP